MGKEEGMVGKEEGKEEGKEVGKEVGTVACMGEMGQACLDRNALGGSMV